MRHDGRWFQAEIVAVEDVADQVRELVILPDGGALPFAVGSHIDVHVQIGEHRDIRSYSLIGEAGEHTYRVAVKAQERSRGGSLYMRSLEPGSRITISSPIAGFELGFDAPSYLLIAGGIGITPLLGMARVLARRDAPFRILYAGRSRAEMAYLADLQDSLGDRLESFAGDEGRRVDLGREIGALPPDAELYLCGPMRMLDEACRIWANAGRPRTGLRFETFGSSGGSENTPFLVELPRLGMTVPVPANVSMLDALTGAGIEVLADCRRGECGLCALNVIGADSAIDHRDVFFSDHEKQTGEKICACVSRMGGGRVLIDPPYHPEQDEAVPRR